MQIAILCGIVPMQIAIMYGIVQITGYVNVSENPILNTLNWKLYSGIKNLYFSVENCSSNPMWTGMVQLFKATKDDGQKNFLKKLIETKITLCIL